MVSYLRYGGHCCFYFIFLFHAGLFIKGGTNICSVTFIFILILLLLSYLGTVNKRNVLALLMSWQNRTRFQALGAVNRDSVANFSNAMCGTVYTIAVFASPPGFCCTTAHCAIFICKTMVFASRACIKVLSRILFSSPPPKTSTLPIRKPSTRKRSYGKQFGETWTTMLMESGRPRHTELWQRRSQSRVSASGILSLSHS